MLDSSFYRCHSDLYTRSFAWVWPSTSARGHPLFGNLFKSCMTDCNAVFASGFTIAWWIPSGPAALDLSVFVRPWSGSFPLIGSSSIPTALVVWLGAHCCVNWPHLHINWKNFKRQSAFSWLLLDLLPWCFSTPQSRPRLCATAIGFWLI